MIWTRLPAKSATEAGQNSRSSKFPSADAIQQGAADKNVKFTYTFDSTKHDRMIEIDSGWRITLGRGLDFLQRAEGRYTLGFIDQSQRKCKETSIVITRK